jgi:hypothetical protein
MTSESDIRERETANPGRAANGCFQPGNPGGPGNPFGGRIAAARGALRDRITGEDLTAIWDRVIAMAKDGHWQAIKLLLSYVAGKPGKMSNLEDFETPSPNGVFSAPPSPNGDFAAPPSPNGVFREVPAAAPSPDGVFAAPPSPSGVFGEVPAAVNRSLDAVPPPAPRVPVALALAPPSPNGVFSAPPRNRKERRAQLKAQRIAERQAHRAPPGAST